MAITIRRKEGESMSGFLYRANRKIQQSGVLGEARRGRFFRKSRSKGGKRASALHRALMDREIQRFLKQGLTLEEAIDRARKIRKQIIKK